MSEKLMWWRALEKVDNRAGGTGRYWAWPADEEHPGVFLARTQADQGVIQFNDRTTLSGNWDGEKGTDGALLTLENGDVYNECGGLVSKGPFCRVCAKHGCHDVAHKGNV